MNEKSGNGSGEQPQQAPMMINGQYIKDMSFESPNSPGILAEMQNNQLQPDINIDVNVNAGQIPGQPTDNLYEVVLTIRAELKLGDKVGFIAELQYAGVFTLNVAPEHISPMQLIECPRMLFPFARAIMADMTREGGFVPLMMQPIDFAGMYQANAQKAEGEG